VGDDFIISINVIVSVRETDPLPFGIVEPGSLGAGDVLLDELPIGIEIQGYTGRGGRGEFLSEKMRRCAKEEGEAESGFSAGMEGHWRKIMAEVV
jgi:hypothetical protein